MRITINTLGADKAWVRSLAFVGLHLAAALFIVVFVITPVRQLLASRDVQIASQRAMLSRLGALAAQESEVEAAAKQAQPDTGEYLAGANEGVINADLQTRLKGMVETTGGRLRAVRVLPPQSVEHIRYIGSHVEFQGTLPAVHRAIAAMEAAKPYLFVREAVLKPAPPVGRPEAAQEPIIDAELNVFGALRLAAGAR
jgi:hypothetical protein